MSRRFSTICAINIKFIYNILKPFINVGKCEFNVIKPQYSQKLLITIAHTGFDVNIHFHGYFLVFPKSLFVAVNELCIYFNSSCVIRLSFAGSLRTIKIHPKYHIQAITPIHILYDINKKEHD